MTNKEIFLNMLYSAENDYRKSLEIAKEKVFAVKYIENLQYKNKSKQFIFQILYKLIGEYRRRKTKYKRLNTGWGLRNYFIKTHNTENIVWKHLEHFRPMEYCDEKTKLWFSCNTVSGFESRLLVIERAIDYYKDVNDFEVPFLLDAQEDFFFYIHLYTAVENGLKDEYAMKVYDYVTDNYDYYIDNLIDEQG